MAVALLVACTEEAPPFPVVATTLALRPSSVAPPRERLSEVTIPPLEGSMPSSTVGFGKGEVTITGRVLGPDGPVPSASVRIERFVGEQSASTIVTTDDQGRYRLTEVTGGQVRLQAFRTPDFAQEESVVGFASEVYAVDLEVAKLSGTRVQWAVAPARPIVDQATNLVVQVGAQRVDADGVVRTGPMSGIGVTVIPLGAMQPTVLESRLTDAAGRVTYPMVCRTTGSSSVRVVLATGEESVVEPQACSLAPTTLPPATPPPQAPADSLPPSPSSVEPPGATVVTPATLPPPG
jgi:hypothetical protein